ncbi:hypothetical protein RMSM_05385 [Rhodopirellula maiorica SM1]|uniref:von Hippel-Lindau disease tumour suppressor beta domain-containing protein n=1 Tax=Rhodopirellula maiorica SM1 TaxID=1265738 RepID=M5RDY6_9BACT|nr:hypothetical protein [Rhodopirellula maiorica]EMI17683.1 hypothetical protein RMSM_05385 [Rhodopirellula maiorica SM1]
MLLISAASASAETKSKTTEVRQRPKLQIINASDQTIDIFWLESKGKRVPNGTLEPGEDTVITTSLGHQFAIVGRQDNREQTVTSHTRVQGVRFDPDSQQGVPSFYSQSIKAKGFPIVASATVNPYALQEAKYLIEKMLGNRADVLQAMTDSGARLCIMAHDEFTTDLPEFAHFARKAPAGFSQLDAKDYWDARARGTGGSETDPFCSVGEENLLAYPGDPYAAESILIHELAHCIHLRGMVNVDPSFDNRLKETYKDAMKRGLWKGKYASVNRFEYFAEGAQSWFDDNRVNDHDHNHVNTRVELIEYDPGLAAMCREVFGDVKFSYSKPTTRLKGHLAKYDPEQAPSFQWPARLTHAKQAIRQHARDRDAKANSGEDSQTAE